MPERAGPPGERTGSRRHDAPMNGERVGRLVSVNVGMPRDVAWQGRTVLTGVWKAPVDGPRRVRRLNIDGDGQGDLAGHGGEQRAVFVYQLDSYRHWERELGPRRLRATASSARTSPSRGWATTRCASATATGSATRVFEVTQPRVTCYRVGIRMNDAADPGPARLPPPARVLPARARGGRGRAGDEIVKVADGPGGDDGRRGRRAALPARAPARAARSGRCASRR